MRTPFTRLALVGSVFLASTIGATTPLAAQSSTAGAGQGQWTIVGGTLGFDAAGTGWSPIIGLELHVPGARRWSLLGARVSYTAMQESLGPSVGRTHVGFAEAQLQAQLPLERFRPYLGVAAGGMSFLTNGGSRGHFSAVVSAAAGARLKVSSQLSLGSEVRARAWNLDGTRSSVEFTLGVSRFY